MTTTMTKAALEALIERVVVARLQLAEDGGVGTKTAEAIAFTIDALVNAGLDTSPDLIRQLQTDAAGLRAADPTFGPAHCRAVTLTLQKAQWCLEGMLERSGSVE